MKYLLIAAMVVLVSPVYADVIDNNLIKAEASVKNAQKRLETAKECAANKPVCLAAMTEKAQKAADRAAKKLADLTQ